MEAIQSFMERYFVPLAAKINGQRHVAAVRDAFSLYHSHSQWVGQWFYLLTMYY